MLISCILTSYNRPQMVRDALRSIESQTYTNHELLILDDSDTFDIRDILADFTLPRVRVTRNSPSAVEVRTQNRLAANCNTGLRQAKGDLICFLCDDDYYYPEWFSDANRFFQSNPNVAVGFGKLSYRHECDPEFPGERGLTRFFPKPLTDPFCVLDHNQVMHRQFGGRFIWNESADRRSLEVPDAYYWRALAEAHVFYPIDAYAAVKRVHRRNLQSILDDHMSGVADRLRE